MSIISRSRKTGKPAKSEDSVQFSSMSVPEKLGALYREYRTEDRNGRLALNRSWFASSLYYQGKQRVDWNGETESLEWYDPLPGEDFYVENQYRMDVNANVATLCRNEPDPEPRPSSASPEDIAAASTAESALHVIHDDVKYGSKKVRKNLFLCLYGNAFAYNGFGYDEKNGKTLIPQYDYEDIETPGTLACPECGNTVEGERARPCPECQAPMEQLTEPGVMPTKVETGSIEQVNGRNTMAVTGPLEMYARSKVGELSQQPYLFWVRRIDTDVVKYYRPKAKVEMDSSFGGEEDLSQYYIDVLSNLAGGPIESTFVTTGQRYYKESEYAMCWIRPESFKGDRELLKKYPHGVKFEVVNGTCIPDSYEDQSMDACWTHYVYLLNPYSFWGDGMVDALPMQDQINETGSLLVRHLRFSTVGKNIYDSDVITPEWLSNNPDEAWIKANRQLDKPLRESVFQIQPTPLSNNVPQWRADQHQAMRDMTKAYDPFNRGANTPYSADVFQAEQAMGQFLPTLEYNKASCIECAFQQLRLFRDFNTDERSFKFRDNTGRWSHQQFQGSDLSAGSFDLFISDAETLPRSKAEKVRGLELYANLQPLIQAGTLSQKQLVYVMDVCGIPPEANPDTLISQKAYRDIEKIVKRGEIVTPNPFILTNLPVYTKTIQEYLVSEEGDELAEENQDAFVMVSDLMMTAMMMAQAQVAAMPPISAPQNGAPQSNAGTPPKPDEPRKAQAPVGEDNKQEMPPLPAGAQQE